MTDDDIDAAARTLHDRRAAGTAGQRLSGAQLPRTPQEGWRVQRRVSALRGPVRGWKCGLPQHDRWVVAALHEAWPAGGPVRAPAGPKGLARIEPEFGFEFARPLPPRAQPYGPADVDAAVGAVRLMVEVLGSRYAEPSSAGGPEMMADSLLNHGIVTGPPIAAPLPEAPDFTLQLTLPGGGERTLQARHGNGNPRLPLYWLAEFLREQGIGIAAGETVITGTLAGIVDWPYGPGGTLRYGAFGSLPLTLEPS